MAKITKLGWHEGTNIIKTERKSAGNTLFQRADGKILDAVNSDATFKNWILKDSSSTILGGSFTYDIITGTKSREFPGASFYGGWDKVAVANPSMALGLNTAINAKEHNGKALANHTTSGSDLLIGSVKNDLFVFNGVSGYDLLDGGAGIDRLVVNSTSADFYKKYDVEKISTILNKNGLMSRDTNLKTTQLIKITDIATKQYTLLGNIEEVKFTDTFMQTGVGKNVQYPNVPFIAASGPSYNGI